MRLRFFHKRRGQYEEPTATHLMLPINIILTDLLDEYVIEQSTGFTDKNGVEIFEGDILQTKNSNQSPYIRDKDKTKRVVKRWDRDNQLHLFHIEDFSRPATGVGLSSNTKNRFEVIGNIHEGENK